MVSQKKPRPSKTGVTSGSLVALYANSPERANLDPSQVIIIPGNSLSPIYGGTTNLNYDLLDDSYDEADSSSSSTDDPNDTAKPKTVPSNADVEIISNTLVFDAAKNPSTTVVFRIKNSSGTTLKGINARIELA